MAFINKTSLSRVLLHLLFIAVLSACVSHTRTASNLWYRFSNEPSRLIGYKDAEGRIRIKPRFYNSSAEVFNYITPVDDSISGKSFYLLKSGRHVGIDSLYMWDGTYDCEQEGKIRFRDRKTDKVGFFDKQGRVLIPARYNDAAPFYNGLAVVLNNGKRSCWDGATFDAKNPCEHWAWHGTTAIIDIKGNIVADSLDVEKTEP